MSNVQKSTRVHWERLLKMNCHLAGNWGAYILIGTTHPSEDVKFAYERIINVERLEDEHH